MANIPQRYTAISCRRPTRDRFNSWLIAHSHAQNKRISASDGIEHLLNKAEEN